MLSRMLMIDDAFEEFRGPLLYRQGMKKVVCFFGEEDIRSLQLTRVSILTLFSMSGLDWKISSNCSCSLSLDGSMDFVEGAVIFKCRRHTETFFDSTWVGSSG